jgi:hypothetical protein
LKEYYPELADVTELSDDECNKLMNESKHYFFIFITNIIRLNEFAKLGMIKKINYKKLSEMIKIIKGVKKDGKTFWN